MNKENNRRFLFWQKWLLYSSVFIAALGLIMAFFGGTILFEPYRNIMASVFWNGHALPSRAGSFISFSMGPLGATIACSYILLAFLAWKPFRNKEVWARNAIAIAFGIWFLADSLVCLYYGVYFQVLVINMISLLQKLLPLIFTWKNFGDT